MKYKNYEIPLKELINWIANDKIDLKPPYQRNDVWTKPDQKSLIDSILLEYPLPTFFVYRRPNGFLEMVDGQQRAMTIYRFYTGAISDSEGRKFSDIAQERFENYKISITEILELEKHESIEKFYVLVNKKGKQLTTPEINKAEYSKTNFLRLVEELLEYQNFINLDLFTETTSKRMNDRSFVEELVAYLMRGITDKKEAVERIYEQDISMSDYERYKDNFIAIVDRIYGLNYLTPIKDTRYKQRNDFYTLFNFVNDGLNIDNEKVLLYQYSILLLIEDYISPSNEDCQVLKNYALNCVSQSNSKNARQQRLQFMEEVLRNVDGDMNETIKELFNFLQEKGLINSFKKINGYRLFDLGE